MTEGQSDQPFHDDPIINTLVIEILDDLLPVVRQMMKGSPLHQFVSPEDIVQDVAVRCRPPLARFQQRTDDLKGDLRKLLNAIARTCVREWARRFKLRLPAIESEVLEQAKRDGHTPSRILGKEQSLDAVRDCLSALDDKVQHIVLRHLVHEETFPAIADALGMTTGQVDGLYRRALIRMRELLGSRSSHQFASSRN